MLKLKRHTLEKNIELESEVMILKERLNYLKEKKTIQSGNSAIKLITFESENSKLKWNLNVTERESKKIKRHIEHQTMPLKSPKSESYSTPTKKMNKKTSGNL